jgi:hypothetical protein
VNRTGNFFHTLPIPPTFNVSPFTSHLTHPILTTTNNPNLNLNSTPAASRILISLKQSLARSIPLPFYQTPS